MRKDEEWYERTILLALDEGDTATATEHELLVEEEMAISDVENALPRSQRCRRPATNNDYLYI